MSPEDKKARVERLDRLQQTISLEYHRSMKGTPVQVLVESGTSERKDAEQWRGRTRTGRLVFVPKKSENLLGCLVEAEITKVSAFAMQGELLSAVTSEISRGNL